MPRGKDQKTISKRIDLHYWKRTSPLRMARLVLVLACTLLAAGWMAYAYTAGSQRIYNPGHVTSAHAIIENDCGKCHAPDPDHKGQFSKAISDNACTTCHEAPLHAPAQLVRDGGNEGNKLALAKWMKSAGVMANQPAADAPAEGAAAPADATAAATSAPSEAAAQPSDKHHGMTMVSSQCATCHTEHRGREALAAVSDIHCTQCHTDLNKAMQPGHTAQVQTRVVAFNKADHPTFGRRIPKDEQGNWTDNTKLQFNHKYHIVEQKLIDCTMCHTTWQPNLVGIRDGHDPDKPPFPAEGTRPAEWAASTSGYMQPVSFEQHCSKCHAIKVKDVGNLPHARMEIVRGQIFAALQKTANDRYAAGAPGAEASGGGSGRRGSSSSKTKSVGPADEGDFLRGELEKLNKAVGDAQKKCAQCHVMKDETEGKSLAMSSLPRPISTPRPAETLTYATLVSDTTTSRIGDDNGDGATRLLEPWDGKDQFHETRLLDTMDVSAPLQFTQARHKRPSVPGADATPAAPDAAAATPGAAAPAATPGASAATPAPSAAVAPPPAPKAKPRPTIKPVKFQTTEPTGIPLSPRKWFVSSRFDHRSHRDMACIECHAKLDNLDKIDNIEDEAVKAKFTTMTTETKTVLSPAMDWTVYEFKKSSGDKWAVSESTRSCTECHRASTGSQRFATDACVTCHAYHDHSKEMFPDGRPEPRVKHVAMANASPMPAPSPASPAPADAKPADGAAAPAAPADGAATATPPAAAPTDAAPAAPAEATPATPPPAAAETPATPAPAAPAETPKPADQAAPAAAEPAPSAAPPRTSRRPKNIPGS